MTDGEAPVGRHAWTWGLGVFLLGLACVTLPRHVQAGDAGEFATVMLRGGVPHPSGYPWMRMLGVLARAGAGMGLGPAFATALPCALAAVAGFMLLHRVALHGLATREGVTRGRTIAATFAIAFLAASPVVVLHAFDCEVWGLLVLAAALLVHAAIVRRRSPFVLGLLFGLGTSHHLTFVLLLPLAITSAWPSRRAERSTPSIVSASSRGLVVLRAFVLGVAGSVLGLLPYATLALGHGGAWRWGDTTSVRGLVHHVLRGDYGITALSLHGGRPPVLAQLGRVASSFGRALSGGVVTQPVLGAALVVLLLVLAGRARPERWRRRDTLGLTSAAVLTIAVFPLAHNIDPRIPFGAWILERFDILGLVLLAPLAALALGPACDAIATARPWLRTVAGACVGLLVLRQLVTTAWHGVPSEDDGIERYAIDVLHTPPPGQRALVFGTDDHRTFPLLYAREVLGHGRDVVYVDASLLAHPWYRAWLRERVPGLPDQDKPVNLMTAIRSDARFDDLALYVANVFSRPVQGLPLVPEGVLLRVLPPGAPPPPLEDVLARHRDALSRYGPRRRTALAPGHPFSADLDAIYDEHTLAIASALRAAGRTSDAEVLLRDAATSASP